MRYPTANPLGLLGEPPRRHCAADLFEEPPAADPQPTVAASAAKVAAAALFAADGSADLVDSCGNFCLLDFLSAAPPPPATTAPRVAPTPYSGASTHQTASNSGAAMIMDGLETFASAHTHPFLLSEAAAAAAHRFSVLSFDSVLYRTVETATGAKSGASPRHASGVPESVACPLHGASDAIPADLNTPVTTSTDVPTFFAPSTVVEPPPITGKCRPSCVPSDSRPSSNPLSLTLLGGFVLWG